MMNTLTFTIYSNKFVPGEYVTKKEMEEHAHKNNYDLIYLDDRVRQKVSSKISDFLKTVKSEIDKKNEIFYFN